MSIRHDVIGDTRDRLGECPLWDTRDQSLYWIDSKGRLVRRLCQGSTGNGLPPVTSDPLH